MYSKGRVTIRVIFPRHVLARICFGFVFLYSCLLKVMIESSVTNNMQALNTMDQSWCVRRWDLRSKRCKYLFD